MKYGLIKVAAATPAVKVADTEYNAGQIIDIVRTAAAGGVKLLVLPELCITGYTCGDLFLQKTLLDGAKDALKKITKATEGTDLLCFVGLPLSLDGKLYNCAAALHGGKVLGIVPKTYIPNYGEFYEKRYFSGAVPGIAEIGVGGTAPVLFGTDLLFSCESLPELIVAAEICEDVWAPSPPSSRHAVAGATVIVNLSASDELVAKDEYRRGLVSGQSARLVSGYIYTDAGEGESTTDVVYTGHNLICENGVLLAESKEASGMIMSELDIFRLDGERRRIGLFSGDRSGYETIPWDTAVEATALTRHIQKTPFVPGDDALRKERCEKILTIQSLGLKKRMEHTGSKYALVGVSGGLDSTLTMLAAARTIDMMGLSRSHLVPVLDNGPANPPQMFGIIGNIVIYEENALGSPWHGWTSDLRRSAPWKRL